MEQQDKIKLLLSTQEHPENYTDEQLAQMLADDPELDEMLEQLSLTKRAFVKMETEKEEIPTDNLWRHFASEHDEELAKLDTCPKREKEKQFIRSHQLRKIAAIFIGILFVAGLAFATIHVVRLTNSNQPTGAESESSEQQATQTSSESKNIFTEQPSITLPTDTIKTDSSTTEKPIVFDNVTLEKMIQEIASYYHADVEFQNDKVRLLRFYFVWKQNEILKEVINRLDRFESMEVTLKENTINIR